MDNPFPADKSNPFQTPYQQSAAPAGSGIKPFAAVDLAPPADQSGSRHGGHAAALPSPFAGGEFGSAFLNREGPMPGPSPKSDTPAPAVPMGNSFSPAPMADFSPAPVAPPEAARQSQILSLNEFNESLLIRKPEFFCTSTHGVDGYQIQKHLGVVSAEVVIPKDILFQNPAAYGELHRMKSAEDQLQKVKGKAMEELADRARQMGADGVVGVTVGFSQFDAVVCLCSAVGTAVKLAD